MDGRVGSIARRPVFELVLAVESFVRFAALARILVCSKGASGLKAFGPARGGKIVVDFFVRAAGFMLQYYRQSGTVAISHRRDTTDFPRGKGEEK